MKAKLARCQKSAGTRRLLEKLKPVVHRSPEVDRVLALPQIKTGTEEWHNIRGKLLTSTSLANVIGIGYQSRHEVFKSKTNQSEPFLGNSATRWGLEHEFEAAKLYELYTGQTLVEEELGFFVHDYEKPGDEGRKRFGATPDFLTINGILVEIKCPFRVNIKNALPRHYIPQVQFQMEVTGLNTLHFVQYRPPTQNFCDDDSNAPVDGTLDIVCVERDPFWWKTWLPVFDSFWDEVIEWHRERDLEIGHCKRRARPEKKSALGFSDGLFNFVKK